MTPRTSVLLPTAVSLALLAVLGCGDDEVERVTAYDESTRPVLLVAPDTDEGMEAIVRGELAVNDAGCVTIGDRGRTFVLVAPYGSSVSGDGTAVEVPGLGATDIGATFEAGGGYLEGPEVRGDPAYADCLTGADLGVVVVAPQA